MKQLAFHEVVANEPQELKDCIEGLTVLTNDHYSDSPERAILTTAIDFLRFRQPLKPFRRKIEYPNMPDLITAQCPACLRRLRTSRTTKSGDAYCPKCGQAIDWSEG